MGLPAFVHNVMVRRRPNRDSVAAQPGYAAWLWRRSGEIARGATPGAIAKRIRFLYSGWRHQDILERFRSGQGNPRLGRLIDERPNILNCLVAPYQSTNWSVRTRLNKLHAHYATTAKLRWLFDPLAEREAELCQLPVADPQLRFVLDEAGWFADEGPLVFNLFLADTRLFSLAFALRFEEGALIAHVGAVQGRNATELPNVKEIYRELTHAAFGMRPRDLLIETFQLLCQHLGVERILLVSNDHQQRRDLLFAVSRHEVHANYDAIWLERGAVRLDSTTFELPLHANRRDAADIPSRKRRQYERRYAMLEAASEEMAATLLARRGDVPTFVKREWEFADEPA